VIESFTDEMMKLATNETWENLKYILGHKKHLYTGGREIDLPRLQLLAHDISKLLPSEFIPYKRFFWGERTPEVTKAFKAAVRKHYARSPHHKEHHTGKMPLKDQLEMVVDWYSAGRTQRTHRFKSFRSWYKKNRSQLPISNELRTAIDSRL
jgi:hypothetical protein